MKNKQGTSSAKIGGQIDSLFREKYRNKAIEIMDDDNICVTKKKILIKELGEQQKAELKK